MKRGDIVVLLRAFTHVDAYEEALERAGLRPFIVGGRGYWTQQQVEDLGRLLGVVSNPLDDEGLYGALASFASCGQPRRSLAAAPGGKGADGHPRHVWPVIQWHFGGGDAGEGEAPSIHAEPLEQIDEEDGERLRASAPRSPACGPRRRCGRWRN